MVLEWNLNAVNAIGNLPTATPPGLGQVPPPSAISLAMVQGAVYDAVNAIDGTHEPYLLAHPRTGGRVAGRGRRDRRARRARRARRGDDAAPVIASLDSLYATSLGKIPDGPGQDRRDRRRFRGRGRDARGSDR